MQSVIAEPGLHRESLKSLLDNTNGVVRIASAYVTDGNLFAVEKRDIRLLTSFTTMDIVAGATSVAALKKLIRAGVKCRKLAEHPRMHAKVYIFGVEAAVVTSANLTINALDSNIEVGLQTDEDVKVLKAWFDGQWSISLPIETGELDEIEKHTKDLRKRYRELLKDSAQKKQLASERHSELEMSVAADDEVLVGLVAWLRTGKLKPGMQFFFNNTDRREGSQRPNGAFVLEEQMHLRGFAAAWEDFNYPEHMKRVKPGDVIFMYAKRVGVVAVGAATGGHQVLGPSASGRIRMIPGQPPSVEWRFPAKWLCWVPDSSACWQINFIRATFLDVTNHAMLEILREHFRPFVPVADE